MTTTKQVIANRNNARKSTGPRSELGKMISSRNSVRHGFYANGVLLPDDDREEFIRFARRLVAAYKPCSVLEEEQVRTIIETRWQLRRATLADTELFQLYRFYEREERGVGTAFAQDATQGNAFSKVTRYQAFHLRKMQCAEKEFARLQGLRAIAKPMPACDATLVLPAHTTSTRAENADSAQVDAVAQRVLDWLKTEQLPGPKSSQNDTHASAT